MAQLQCDLIEDLQHVHNIAHHSPVPLLNLLEGLVVILVLLSTLHVQQGWLEDNKAVKHQVG